MKLAVIFTFLMLVSLSVAENESCLEQKNGVSCDCGSAMGGTCIEGKCQCEILNRRKRNVYLRARCRDGNDCGSMCSCKYRRCCCPWHNC